MPLADLSTFLLEIGTEELPADFVRLAPPQLEKLVSQHFEQRRLGYGKILSTATPRRIVLLVDDLASKAEDFEEERKGPPASTAFVNGSPTAAAIGFAKRFGLEVNDLEVRETAKGAFVFAKVIEQGVSANELLAEIIPNLIAALQGKRFMRWGTGERRFSRPIRWLVSLLDSEVVPVCLDGGDPKVLAGKSSRGHRLHKRIVNIESASSYLDSLLHAGVMVERTERNQFIKGEIEKSAEKLNAIADVPQTLLDELTDLVESPDLIEGEVDDSFLDLPAEVLSTVMRLHQRYIPLYKKNASKDSLELQARNDLLPRFICIGNGLKESRPSIKRGNERVLKARLADAEFFVQADRAVKSSIRCEQLAQVTFADGLGSVLDRVHRLEWVAQLCLSHLTLANSVSENVLRAASLSKHDLVSQIVGEFPELQGIMGAKYLIAEEESREVALAVSEQYLPRGAGDLLPESEAGAVLALVDRLELLISIYSKGERPSGSSDPYGLRRAGNGILQILWSRGLKLNLYEVCQLATIHWSKLFPDFSIDHSSLFIDIGEFFQQRISTLLEEAGVDIDIAQAVSGKGTSIKRLLSDPSDCRTRANLLTDMRRTGELIKLQAVVTRASRLAEKGDLTLDILSASGVVNPSLFEKKSEHQMLSVINSLEPIAVGKLESGYKQLADGLQSSTEALSCFFDGDQSVMVMTENLEVRKNRLNMLGVLRNQARLLADFSQIVG
ncbi:glycine--tRNA ligase subunit beta [Prochlorococcus sp. MIT 1300]|uniref:glycine--tRNA ligase subunit beta n=1 Tax=Prochlorococcus sp. MIT 1300 TaxID=3096218 RepID=UPI002A753BC0|nr:glycine--tRNA ligase subunit beta [Prochlorococcus sp. MIT 1300]